MEIKQLDPNSLISYEYNNKIHNQKQIDLLANSIKEFGFNTPVIIDNNNIIIAGHGRVEASKKLGLKEIPCIQKIDLTKSQIKKYRLLDNKISEIAEDNIDNIKFELEYLQDLELDELYMDLGNVGDIDFDKIESNEDRSNSDRTREVECPHCGEKFSI